MAEFWQKGRDKIVVVCPQCKKEIAVQEKWRTFTCYNCGNIIERSKV